MNNTTFVSVNNITDLLQGDQWHNEVTICFIPLSKKRKYRTYHIHYSKDIGFHMVTSMIFNHLTVCNHKRLHPSLLADRAPRDLSDSHMTLFPPLPPILLLFEKAEGIWKSKKQHWLENIFKLDLKCMAVTFADRMAALQNHRML